MDSIGDSPDMSEWIYERQKEEEEERYIESVGLTIRSSIATREARKILAKILKDMSDEDIIFMYKEINYNMKGFRSGDFDKIFSKRGYPISDDEKLIRIARNKPKEIYKERVFKYLDKYKESTVLTNSFYNTYKKIEFIYVYSTEDTYNEKKASWIYVDGGSGHIMFKIPHINNIDDLSADEIILLLKEKNEIKILS